MDRRTPAAARSSAADLSRPSTSPMPRSSHATARCDDSGVPTLNDLARSYTSLRDDELECLHSLVSDWQLLADLSFADLILWAPTRKALASAERTWIAIAQMRPTTGPTSFQDDVVGTFAKPEEQRLLDVAQQEKRIWRES